MANGETHRDETRETSGDTRAPTTGRRLRARIPSRRRAEEAHAARYVAARHPTDTSRRALLSPLYGGGEATILSGRLHRDNLFLFFYIYIIIICIVIQ